MGFHILTDKQLDEIVAKRIRDSADDAAKQFERDILIKQANIRLLQSQINPHFLYNTLECIRAQAIIDGSDALAITAQSLALFFRYSISSKNDIVSIREELENIRNYVTIQQYRFKEKFTLEIGEISDELLDASIPKLSIQPIVENSIIHGFSDVTSNGLLSISVRKTANDNMTVRITDNGKGMDPTQLSKLYSKIHREPDDKKIGERSSIGLWNVDRRLKLFYGKEYGMTVYSTEGRGTTVEMFFPMRLIAGRP